ncbi:hypothetical protein Pla22_25560 [Rubripirellula amarantea]|uniref:Ice-binding protein C-terminal domain-containing protein n=1 Tax=Rubripirellula amarantea TaxID=2527999 RepID=A0A5C5WYC4_9BACT|nr:PEP-CTERM sorting domain-containing protein [Rubripirellula amarantea]TWT54902.1 hypothetical protein Pla22_25560 [Rubripirellula amarantea]
MKRFCVVCTLIVVHLHLLAARSSAELISVINPGFEDISDESVFNEFTFGPLNGWQLYDPNSVAGSGAGPNYYIGTLTPDPPTNFISGAAEGQRVGIAFNFAGTDGQGEYGMQQTLTATLQAHTDYSLMVDIGNIASGTAQNNTFFDLDGFPGYRVDLLAGGVVLHSDDNSLSGAIAEGEFGTSVLSFTTGDTHAQLGQALGIRLVNLNQLDASFPDANLEVDFDNVRLNAVAVPEPSSLFCLAIGFVFTIWRRRHDGFSLKR